MCTVCGSTQALKPWKKGFYLKDQRLPVAKQLIEQHPEWGVRRIAELAFVSKNTAAALVKKFRQHECACGQIAGHRGWCKVRFQQSESRKTMMARMHGGPK